MSDQVDGTAAGMIVAGIAIVFALAIIAILGPW